MKKIWETNITNHPRLSAKPFHKLSVLTILSINFFHNMPSEITRYHSLHTNSAEHNDLASRNDKIDSAMWSKPFAEEESGEKNILILFCGF